MSATGGDSQVSVAWSAVSGATSYKLYYRVGEGASPSDTAVPASMVSGTTATVTGLTNGVAYSFAFVAYKDTGRTAASSIASATPSAFPEGSVPANVSATGEASKIRIEWDAVDGATSYAIYWSNASGFSLDTANEISGILSTSYTHAGLTNGTAYYYVVTAVKASGESAASAQAEAVPATVVYVGGRRNTGTANDYVAGYWKNGAWKALHAYYESTVTAIVASGDDIYAGGYLRNYSDDKSACYWKNGVWIELSGFASTSEGNYTVTSLAVSGSEVYVGGFYHQYDSSNSIDVSKPGYWKNGTWIALSQTDTSSGEVAAISLSGADLYVAGYNSGPGYWKNGVWNELPNLYGGGVCSLFLDGTDLYVSGHCDSSSNSLTSTDEPGYWKNGVWNELPYSGPKGSGEAYSIWVSSGDAYAAGFNRTYDGSKTRVYACYWKNGVKYDLPQLSYSHGYATSLAVSGTDVYVTGNITDIGNGSYQDVPGYWKNGSWTALAFPSASTYSETWAACVLVQE